MADKNVQMPDGSVVAFPDSMSDDAIATVLKTQHPAAAPAEKSLLQRAKDKFDALTTVTPQQEAGHGAAFNAVQRFGAGAIQGLGAPIVHPLDTAMGIARFAANPTYEGYAMAANTAEHPAQTAGNVIGGAILGEAAPLAIAPVADAVKKGASAVGDAASAAKAKLYPTSQSLAPATSAARNLAKALVVSPQAAPNFVRAATDEAGTVVDFAQKNNLPINSKVDFANAAEATAKAVQDHFNENILGPNAKEVVSVPSDYRGSKLNVEGSRATIGDINNRINAINQELNPNFRKGLASQTSAANVSDADLIAEKSALTNILHKKLATATGLQPEDIAGIRQQAGKLRTVADESQLSANMDTTAAGRQGMGATTTSSIGTKAGIIDRTLQAVQGGPEVIGNRQILSALQKIQAKPLNLPQPTATGAAPPTPRAPISGGPSTTMQGPDYTPDPNAAAILRARIAGRLKPAPVPVQPPPQLRLPAQTGGAYVLPNSVVPQMSEGEQIAALMQYLRKHPQAALPAKAGAIPLPPPK